MDKRPKKKNFSLDLQESLREKAIQFINSKLLPNDKIIKIILIGSSIKGDFGEYEPPGFRDSLFSDFDFIVFTENDYEIPEWLDKEPTGKPFSNDKLNLTYRNKRIIDNKYDLEVFFIKRESMNDLEIQKEGELAGIPFSGESEHKYILIYSNNKKEAK